jgi:hypothetical protein
MTLAALHQEYIAHRIVQLSEAEFASLISFTPVLLVAVSDHNIDHLETGYLTGLLAEQTMGMHTQISDSPPSDALLQTFVEELRYLLYHLDRWEASLLDVLTQHLLDKPQLKERIRIQMVAMALASRGINDLERAKMKAIGERLGIAV